MRAENDKIKGSVILTILPLLSVFITVITGILSKSDFIEILKISLMTFILTTIIAFYIRIQENILSIKFAKSIVFISYLSSLLLIMLMKDPQSYCFWMIGSLLITMLVDKKLGLSAYFNLTIILCITYSIEPETLIHLLVMGILLVLLSDALKSKSTVIYALIIILSTNITLSFILNNFIFDTKRNVNYLASFFSIFAVLVTAFLLSLMYDKLAAKYKNNVNNMIENIENGNTEGITDEESKQKTLTINEAVAESAAAEVNDSTENEAGKNTTEAVNDSGINEANEYTVTAGNEIIPVEVTGNPALEGDDTPYTNTRASYDVLLSENNELLLRLKEHSEKVYNHCRLIGDLSAKAAKEIGADEALARAGGYYHEIGKINGNNYIEEGLKLADEYSFPEKLKDILKQHNIKYDKPTFVESAIVMISDNVASTIDYIEKNGDQKFTSDKIIDNLFRMLLEKGTFDDSGLSVRDFKILKEFYQKEFKSYGKNE